MVFFGYFIRRAGVHSILSSLQPESGYLLESTLGTGVLRMWQSIIITQGSLSLEEGPRHLWMDVFGKVILARLQA